MPAAPRSIRRGRREVRPCRDVVAEQNGGSFGRTRSRLLQNRWDATAKVVAVEGASSVPDGNACRRDPRGAPTALARDARACGYEEASPEDPSGAPRFRAHPSIIRLSAPRRDLRILRRRVSVSRARYRSRARFKLGHLRKAGAAAVRIAEGSHGFLQRVPRECREVVTPPPLGVRHHAQSFRPLEPGTAGALLGFDESDRRSTRLRQSARKHQGLHDSLPARDGRARPPKRNEAGV